MIPFAEADMWELNVDGVSYGPFSLNELKKEIRRHNDPCALVRHQEKPDQWYAALDVVSEESIRQETESTDISASPWVRLFCEILTVLLFFPALPLIRKCLAFLQVAWSAPEYIPYPFLQIPAAVLSLFLFALFIGSEIWRFLSRGQTLMFKVFGVRLVAERTQKPLPILNTVFIGFPIWFVVTLFIYPVDVVVSLFDAKKRRLSDRLIGVRLVWVR